jgi:hypothetical protein
MDGHRQKPITKASLNKIAALAGISDDKRPEFFTFVQATINQAWQASPQILGYAYQTDILKVLAEYGDALRKTRDLLAGERVDPAGHRAQVNIRAALARTRRVALDEFGGVCEDLISAVAKAIERVKKDYNEVGRPPKPRFGNAAYPEVVRFFLFATRSLGGELTNLKHAGQTSGGLKEALEILRPFLPPEFLPPFGPDLQGARALERIVTSVNEEFGQSPK